MALLDRMLGEGDAPLLMPGRAPYDGLPSLRLMLVAPKCACGARMHVHLLKEWVNHWAYATPQTEVGPELTNPLDGGRPRPAEWSEWLELEFDKVASPCSSF